jgi:hypothetical protein
LRGSGGEVTLGGAARINFNGVQQFENTLRGRVFGVMVARSVEQLVVLDGPPLEAEIAQTLAVARDQASILGLRSGGQKL